MSEKILRNLVGPLLPIMAFFALLVPLASLQATNIGDVNPPVLSVEAKTLAGDNYTEGDWAKGSVIYTVSSDEPAIIYYCLATDDSQCQSGGDFVESNTNPLMMSNLNQGQSRLYYFGLDAAGNFSATKSFATRIDNSIPSPRMDGPDEGAEVSGKNVGVVTTGEDSYSLIKSVCVYVANDDSEGLLQPQACKDINERDWFSYDYAPSFSYSWDTTTVADGAYRLFSVMTDLAGNTATSAPRNLTINNYSLGTPGNPASIKNCSDLQAVNDHLRWHYVLENDIDCSETKEWNGGAGFASIGNYNGFSGQIDGQGHTVYGLYMNSSENRGFFGSLSGGILKNINFKKVDFFCNSTYCAVIANVNWGRIENIGLTGKLVCSGKCGGIASQNSGTISKSWADLVISEGPAGPGYAGLIAGQNYGGRVEYCYAKGRIIASQGGGIVGLNENTNVYHSYSVAEILAPEYGGQNGGLIGWQYQGGSQTASYWDVETSGMANMCGSYAYNSPDSCADANGLSDAMMKEAASYSGWDFSSIWAIDPAKNDGYPYLRGQTMFSALDLTAPIVSMKGSAHVSLYIGDTYTDAGASAQDDMDGDISAKIIIDNQVDTSLAGDYYVTYNVSDDAGNAATEQKRWVTVSLKPSAPASSGGGGGLIRTSPQPDPVFQIYDPLTGILTTGNEKGAEGEEEVIVLGVSREFPILSEAEIIASSGADKQLILAESGKHEDLNGEKRLAQRFSVMLGALSGQEELAARYFILYGTHSSLALGEGERAGVLVSYQRAFGRLPRLAAEWEDVLLIAQGRWPQERSKGAEEVAAGLFAKIYKRDALMTDRHDSAAIMVMAYGLRPTPRNLASELRAVMIFRSVFGKIPGTSADWDAVRAIAYSGAKR